MNDKTHTYEFLPGLFSKPSKLTITPENIEYQNSAEVVCIKKDSFLDVKYRTEPIEWYKFTVGYSYRIQIKYDTDKVLTIPMAGYLWSKKDYGHMYSDISRHVGNYFLLDRINNVFDGFHEERLLQMPGLIIRQEGVSLENPDHTMEWKDVGLKEYYHYFAIFDKANPTIHKRVTFDEWNAEVLFHVMKGLINAKEERRRQ